MSGIDAVNPPREIRYCTICGNEMVILPDEKRFFCLHCHGIEEVDTSQSDDLSSTAQTKPAEPSADDESLVNAFHSSIIKCVEGTGSEEELQEKRKALVNQFIQLRQQIVRLEANRIPPDHLEEICRPRCGEESCRYLAICEGSYWVCLKNNRVVAKSIDHLVALGALQHKADNCISRGPYTRIEIVVR